jgi:hypothetical protein
MIVKWMVLKKIRQGNCRGGKGNNKEGLTVNNFPMLRALSVLSLLAQQAYCETVDLIAGAVVQGWVFNY